MNIEKTRILEKLEGLKNKWKGKEPTPKTTEWFRMKGDRLLYRTLKRKLGKIDVVDDIFGNI